jgi:hypothetical protein
VGGREATLVGTTAYTVSSERPVAPNTPIVIWWLNGSQVATGDSYTMPYSNFVEGVHEYKARVQNLDGTHCESDATITINPSNFGSLSGCYFIRTEQSNGRHPTTNLQ